MFVFFPVSNKIEAFIIKWFTTSPQIQFHAPRDGTQVFLLERGPWVGCLERSQATIVVYAANPKSKVEVEPFYYLWEIP